MSDNKKSAKTFENYLTVKDASQFIGVSEATIRNWDRAGKLNAHRHPINNYRLYDPEELHILLQEVLKVEAFRRTPKDSHISFQEKSLKIIVVEDNLRDMELLNRALEKIGFDGPVTLLKDGAIAIDYFTQYIDLKKPTIVLLDMKLPKVDGIDVLRHIKSQTKTKKIPVIILTTCSSDKNIETCYALGASGYILKSVSFEKFNFSIRSCLRYWMEINQLPPYVEEV